MSGLKVNGEVKREKGMLNTTIDKQIFEEFKTTCKQQGMRINTLLEIFMRQYTAGEFTMRFINKKPVLELEDNNK